MPVYPCIKCNSPVDPATDRACRNCKEAKPLECSRCHKKIPTEDVYQRETMKTKKPIFCLECGEREAVVKCALCNLSLQRHQGRQVSQLPGAKVYHPHCLNERQKQMDRLGKFQPVLGLIGLILGGLIGYVKLGAAGAAGGSILLAVLLFGMLNFVRNRLSPS